MKRPKSFDDWYRAQYIRWGWPPPDETLLAELWKLNLADEATEHQ